MKPTTYKYENFEATVFDYKDETKLLVTCKLDGQGYTREYDIDETITSIDEDGEYLNLKFNDGEYQIKFEGDSVLVIDTFDSDGNHLVEIGCHDFWDDVQF